MSEALTNVSIVTWHVKTLCDSWTWSLPISGQDSCVRIIILDIPQDRSIRTHGWDSLSLISQTSQCKDREMNTLQMSGLHKTSTSDVNSTVQLAICDKKFKGFLH
jgi:hypothetical protein